MNPGTPVYDETWGYGVVVSKPRDDGRVKVALGNSPSWEHPETLEEVDDPLTGGGARV